MTGTETDREFLIRRAREERVAALMAEDESAAIAHLQMAKQYEAKIDELASSKA
jgi:hypothetical protein